MVSMETEPQTCWICSPIWALPVFLAACIAVLPLSAAAQKVYLTDSEMRADLVVFESPSEVQADLKVFLTDYQTHAGSKPGVWYITDSEVQSDMLVYITNSQIRADLIIHYVNSQTHAGR